MSSTSEMEQLRGKTGGAKPRKAATRGPTSRWLLAIAVALAVHGMAYFLMDVSVPSGALPEVADAHAVWLGGTQTATDSMISEQLLLFDNAPLFLPTEWNASTAETASSNAAMPSELFGSFDTRLTVEVSANPPMLDLLPEGTATAIAGVPALEFDYLSAWAREPISITSLPPRLAQIEVREGFTGRPVGQIAVETGPAEEAPDWPDWEPFDILVDIDSAGWQGPPLITKGSGVGAVDAFFRDYVRRRLRLDLRFGPGQYRLRVGP